jgi:sigma-E factor negative regulatory protein RseC
MASEKEVTHIGIVKQIENGGIRVSIVTQSGCASCQIKGSCNMSEQKEKELEIDCIPSEYHIGQQVEVRLKESQGFHALFLGYILPFLVLIITMFLLSITTSNEGIIGLGAIASLVVYYGALMLFRDKIKKKFTYEVYPLNV